jgi:diguanylate cyclase (GGDEF)-like protein
MAVTRLEEDVWSRKPFIAAAAVVGIAIIAAVDFVTGAEVRIFPLYFLPLGLAAWHLGRAGALAAAVLCTISWIGSNYLAGLRFSAPAVWVINVLTQATSFVVVGLLIAAVRSALAREVELGRTDPLTGLLNGRAFDQQAEHVLALARRYGHDVTLAYIDLDNFKAVNDTLGHHGGDDMLRTTADSIRQCIRAGDVCARLGGDEFVVLLPETKLDGAGALLERLRSSLAETLGRSRCTVSASIGAVAFTAPPPGVDEVIRHADQAMYVAKSAGKDRVCLQTVGTARQVGTPTAEAASSTRLASGSEARGE